MKRFTMIAAVASFGLIGGLLESPKAMAQYPPTGHGHQRGLRNTIQRFVQPFLGQDPRDPYQRGRFQQPNQPGRFQQPYQPGRFQQPNHPGGHFAPQGPVGYQPAPRVAQRFFVKYRFCHTQPWCDYEACFPTRAKADCVVRQLRAQGYAGAYVFCQPRMAHEYLIMIRNCHTQPWAHYSDAYYGSRASAEKFACSLRSQGYHTRVICD